MLWRWGQGQVAKSGRGASGQDTALMLDPFAVLALSAAVVGAMLLFAGAVLAGQQLLRCLRLLPELPEHLRYEVAPPEVLEDPAAAREVAAQRQERQALLDRAKAAHIQGLEACELASLDAETLADVPERCQGFIAQLGAAIAMADTAEARAACEPLIAGLAGQRQRCEAVAVQQQGDERRRLLRLVLLLVLVMALAVFVFFGLQP